MKLKMRRVFAVMLALVLLFSNTSVAFAASSRPGQGGNSDVYDHIDVRQEGPSITMTYVTKNLVTGEVVNTRTVTIDCTVTGITSVSYTQLKDTENEQSWTWTSGFSNDGTGYEFRLMNQSFSKDLSGSYATIIVDLTDTNGNVYEDVVFTFGPSGCQQAVYDCDGYSSGNGRGSVGLDFILGVNNDASIVYTNWVIPVEKIWNDDDDRDGIRPESVNIDLLANGVVVDSATLNAANNWYYEFTDKEAADANGNLITYTIQENPVPDGYTASVNNFTVTNTHVLETTSVSGSKTWVDNDDQDGMRPDSVTVELYANGAPTGKTATVTAEDNWTWTFTDLLANANGEPIAYTVVETPVDGYEATYDGMNVTNTHNPIKIELTVTKTWDDNNNQDGIRPDSIIVELYANGEPTGKTITISGDDWTGTFTDLDMYANGEEIVYTVVEQAVEGYESNVDGLTITNVHIPEVTEVSGSKTWNDANNQDGLRPESITVNLLKDGEVIDTATATAENGWAWSFTDLPKYENEGTPIQYVIEEIAVSGYTTVIDGYNVTNTHEVAKTEVTVTKIWDDAGNQDGIRPTEITVELYANGEPTGKTLVITGSNWTGTFANLDKYYDGGKEVVYTVVETAVAGYTTSYSEDGLTVTNTHVPAVTEVKGSKTWNDNNNQDGVRPASITINLVADGAVIKTITVTEADNWSWSFTNLPKYKAEGVLINYSITETAVEDYTTSYNGFNVINTHAPAKTSVTVSKVWEDNNDQDGIRSSDITVELVANNEPTGITLVLNEGNNWTGSFENLDKFADGAEIAYTVAEISVEGYTTTITGDQNIGYIITNTHETETVEVSGSKTWVDAENQDGFRPESITINLLKNGEIIDTVVVTEEDEWAWSFENLPKYENHGTLINYSISEEAVEDYSTTYNGYNVTNTHTPEQTSITVTKSWHDNFDQDGIRPEDITVELVANNEPTGMTLVLNEGNNWTGSFAELDKYANGEQIVYTVAEVAVEGYNSAISGDQTAGYTITNSHTPEVTSVSGSKTWNDADNQDGFRPESITINLLKNGEVIDSVVVTAEDGWAWSFDNLPKYENHGTLITYTVTENAVEDYTTSYNGFDVTNTHAPEKTSVTVTKSWQDNFDQDGIRPESITVVLVANGEATENTLILTENNGWTGTFGDLDKYANGEIIDYTVDEIAVEGYNTVVSGDQDNGYTITNSHTPETVEISGSKTWDDNNNQDGFRPESITIHLLKNGEIIDTVVVTEEDEWTWSFAGLPKYENHGTLINYSISEEAVEDYSTTYNGYNVTNAHTPEQTSVTVVKSWQDNDDQDGIRPEEITVELVANNEPTGIILVLNEGNNWTGSFTELDKYEAGVVIIYSVAEMEVAGYNTVITGDQTTGYTITNSHTPETVEISGSKTWDDNNNQDGFRPESITINLLKNGTVIETIEVTAESGWAWSFTNLPKYENHGTLITYGILESAVEEYTTSYNGYDVINTHAPEKTSVSVTKAWADHDNQDGIRPNDVTIALIANGELTDLTVVLNEGNNWTGSFENLDKYFEGEEITYTVEEVVGEDGALIGYEPVVSGSHADGFTVTNCYTPETIAISGQKTWKDKDNQDGVRPESITIRLLADGEEVASAVVTEIDEWTWNFENLPKYRDGGIEIIYTVTEDAVEDYSTEYKYDKETYTFHVTNEHTPEQTSVTVTKQWEDKDDQDGIRPDEITVILVANGEATEEKLVLDAENNWTGSFTELDKYAEGEEITYTVEEVEVEGYVTTVSGDATQGFVITNCHTPEVIEISGGKTWDDNDDQDGKRPEEITINLMANGQVIKTIAVTEADEWTWTFENLPKYENGGQEIVYAITENAVEGYTTTYDGYNMTNSYTPAEISLTVTKAWADSNNEDGLRPKKITITLYANGELTDETLVLTAEDNWSGSFVGLPKYVGGQEIVYTIGEISVNGYNTVIRGSMEKGFVVTNSHTVIPQTGDERMPMLWMLLMISSAAAAAYVVLDTKKRNMVK